MSTNILDRYVTTAPSPQNAVDIFQGAWTISFTAPLEEVVAGNNPLFLDPRVPWAAERLGGFQDKTVLELGPLEAAQSYRMEQLGARHICAIEANTTAYVRCLIVKELYKLQHVEFLCGDFVPYLRENKEAFDVAFASGVLYHMRRPVELLYLLSQVSDKLFLWTHYYDRDLIAGMPHLVDRFPCEGQAEFAGFKHTLYRQEYQASLNWNGFCGGSADYSYWLSRSDILSCLQYFGYDDLQIGFDETSHHGGPCFAIAATRSTNGREQKATVARPLEYSIEQALLDKEIAVQQQPEPQPVEDERLMLSRELLAEQDVYIAHLEQVLQEKEAHIAALERLLDRVSQGRMMKVLNALKRS